jgi:cation:H+ antiporter
MSSMSGNGALSLGNIIGADIINICLVFGILAMIGMKVDKKDVDELIYSFILVSIVALFLIFMGTADAALGIFLLIIFIVFSKTLLEKGVEIKHAHDGQRHKMKFALLTIFGVSLVILSSRVVSRN